MGFAATFLEYEHDFLFPQYVDSLHIMSPSLCFAIHNSSTSLTPLITIPYMGEPFGISDSTHQEVDNELGSRHLIRNAQQPTHKYRAIQWQDGQSRSASILEPGPNITIWVPVDTMFSAFKAATSSRISISMHTLTAPVSTSWLGSRSVIPMGSRYG